MREPRTSTNTIATISIIWEPEYKRYIAYATVVRKDGRSDAMWTHLENECRPEIDAYGMRAILRAAKAEYASWLM